jgi:hypothetical protein
MAERIILPIPHLRIGAELIVMNICLLLTSRAGANDTLGTK